MSSLYLGVRLPSKPFERLKLLNIDLPTKNVAELKLETEKMLNLSHNELRRLFCNSNTQSKQRIFSMPNFNTKKKKRN